MHEQIKAIISTFRALSGGRVLVDFTCGQQTAMGRVLHDMYYGTRLTDMLTREESNGYPHNGGQHSFQLTCKPLDAIAYIEVMKERLTAKRTFNIGHRQVINELSYISQELHVFRRMMKYR